MPGPSSATSTQTRSGVASAVTRTVEPGPPYLAALPSRFRRICSRYASSPTAEGSPCGAWASNVTSGQRTCSEATTRSSTRPGWTGSSPTSRLPPSTLVITRRSSTSRYSRSASSTTSPRRSSRAASSISRQRRASTRVPPKIVVIGVRSSWLTTPMNASRSRAASRSAAMVRSRAASASLRSVMSRTVPSILVGRSPGSPNRRPELASQRMDPSRRRIRSSVSYRPPSAKTRPMASMTPGRSSGWTSTSQASSPAGVSPADSPCSAQVTGDHVNRSSARRHSQEPMPDASRAYCSRSSWSRSSRKRRARSSAADPWYARAPRNHRSSGSTARGVAHSSPMAPMVRPSKCIGITAEPSAPASGTPGTTTAGNSPCRSAALAWNWGSPVRTATVIGTSAESGTRIHGEMVSVG